MANVKHFEPFVSFVLQTSVHAQVMTMFNMISVESSSAYSKSGDDKHGFRYYVNLFIMI